MDRFELRDEGALSYRDLAVRRAAVKVGDIYASSWGYDQTNVDFYKVVGLTPSGKSARLVKIGSRTVETTGWASRRVVADPERETGTPFTKRILAGGDWFSLTSYSGASRWDGLPMHESSYA